MPMESIQGNGPVILTLPYTGSNIQRAVALRLRDESLCYTVPDRYLDRVMSGLHPDLNLVRANFHRYMSDVEYPFPADNDQPVKGMLGVVPLLDSQGKSIWDTPPTKKEAASWRAMCYAPYHAAIAAQVARVRARYGYAVLVTCRANNNPLPANPITEPKSDIGIATYLGASGAIDLGAKLNALFAAAGTHTSSLNGRMHAGWSTRRYGRPYTGVHAIDLILNERCYLTLEDEEAQYKPEAAATIHEIMKEAFELIHNWRPR
jgi:formiminoglutamase